MMSLLPGEKFALTWLGVGIVSLAGWITHVIYCLQTAKYVLLIAGGLVAPIGTIHGIGLWFGAW